MPQRFVSGLSQGDQPVPGSFGLARIGGLSGKLIAAGQAFAGDGSRWTHAFVVLDNGEVIEAEPGGAVIRPLQRYLDMEEVAFSDRPVQDTVAAARKQSSALDLTDEDAFWAHLEAVLRDDVVTAARGLEGSPYGYLQYLAMGLLSVGFEWKWLERYIANRNRLICSQLVDEVYRRVGIHVFTDHRPAQQVTPGDLAIRYGIG